MLGTNQEQHGECFLLSLGPADAVGCKAAAYINGTSSGWRYGSRGEVTCCQAWGLLPLCSPKEVTK